MATLQPQQFIGRKIITTENTRFRSQPNRSAQSKVLFVAPKGMEVGAVIDYIKPIPNKANGYYKVIHFKNNNANDPLVGYLDAGIVYVSKNLNYQEKSLYEKITDFLFPLGKTMNQATQPAAEKAGEAVKQTVQATAEGFQDIAKWTKWLLIGAAGLIIYKFANNATNLRNS